MAALIRERVGRRPFVTARYLVLGDRYEPEAVRRCPESLSDQRPCRLRAKDWRERANGPAHALRVLACATHDCCFTIYPLDYGPFERRPSAAVAPDGSPLVMAAGDDADDALRATKFAAVIDFLAERRWPPDLETAEVYGMPNPPGVFRTQVRHINRSAHFFGIAPHLSDDFRLKTSRHLGIATQRLVDSAKRVRDGPSWRTRAVEVGAFLRELRPLHTVLLAMARQGEEVGLWGTPLGT